MGAALETAVWACREAGAATIPAGQPFERRMRDIHAPPRQVPGRSQHIGHCEPFPFGLAPEGHFI